MKKQRRIKRREYEKRKQKRIMQYLQKKNKMSKRRARGTTGYVGYCQDVYRILDKSKEFNQGQKEYGKGEKVYDVPYDFSISNNAEQVIEFISRIFNGGKQLKVREQCFNHTACKNMDVAASVIMDTVVLAIQTYRRKINNPLDFSGTYQSDSKIVPLLETSGIIEHLQASTTSPRRTHSDLMLFKMKSGKVGSKKSDYVATKLSEYFQKCLQANGYCLNDDGQNYMGKMFGEVINNCEIHGGANSVWYTSGYYQHDAISDYGQCQLVVFNYGDSIYKRMCDMNQTSKETKKLLEEMDNKHKNCYNKNWTKEALYTVLSLQEGISRLRDRTVQNNKKRGTGTIRLLESFLEIGKSHNGEEPKLDIISGHVHIKIDERYHLQPEQFDDEIFGKGTRKIIAFNKRNDIYERADEKCVKVMHAYFPGTIIAMSFYLDSKYLDEISKGR